MGISESTIRSNIIDSGIFRNGELERNKEYEITLSNGRTYKIQTNDEAKISAANRVGEGEKLLERIGTFFSRITKTRTSDKIITAFYGDNRNFIAKVFGNALFGTEDERRYISDRAQNILSNKVSSEKSENVTLKGEAGILTGHYHKSNVDNVDKGKVVLFLHGSHSSAEEQSCDMASYYQEQGVSVLAVNMRGYGKSHGTPSESGLYRDAQTMFDYLVNEKGFKNSDIIIHGYSMGAPVAAYLANTSSQNEPVSGLLLDRPMPSMVKAIKAHRVPNPVGLTGQISKMINGRFSVENNIAGISSNVPVMLLTDNEGLGEQGEVLRQNLMQNKNIAVSGHSTQYGHTDTLNVISINAKKIIDSLGKIKG